MLKLTELNYHCHHEFNAPAAVLEKHRLSSAYIHFLEDRMDLLLVKHLDHEGEDRIGKIRYRFCKSRNRGWYIPFRTHRFIKKEKPDIVLIQGFVFPLQVIALRLSLGNKPVFILTHHGERPFKGWKKWIQQIADRCVNAYTFTSKGNAADWINGKVIRDISKCHELLEASTTLKKQDKTAALLKTGVNGNPVFLWVGRLNANKDPLCMLEGFSKYALSNPSAKLYMIFQENDMEAEVSAFINNNSALKKQVVMTGKIPHEELEWWYSAADYYISASHKEGSGYALLEAMACGCIPIVTDIPSFRQMTNNGSLGLLYQPGNSEELYERLSSLNNIDNAYFSIKIMEYSKREHSASYCADKLYELCRSLHK